MFWLQVKVCLGSFSAKLGTAGPINNINASGTVEFTAVNGLPLSGTYFRKYRMYGLSGASTLKTQTCQEVAHAELAAASDRCKSEERHGLGTQNGAATTSATVVAE
jgi:hypothetical protein